MQSIKYLICTQVRKLRKKMSKVIQDEIQQSDLKEVVNKLYALHIKYFQVKYIT